MPDEAGRVQRPHFTAVRQQWNGYRVSCSACDLYEQHEDETTAHREAERHRQATPTAESGRVSSRDVPPPSIDNKNIH